MASYRFLPLLTWMLFAFVAFVACGEDGSSSNPGDADLSEPEIDATEYGDEDTESEEIEAEREINPDCIEPGFDAYFGALCHETEATGYFRVDKIGGRWWLISPEGHPFFSTGMNVLNINGTATHDGVKHYRDYVLEKYGDKEAWATATFERCKQWGINTAGGWSQWEIFADRLPFTVTLSVAGSNMTDNGPHDFFSPEFETRARGAIEQHAEETRENPYCIGYFMDNEMHWGNDHRGKHLFIEYMAMDEDAPGKLQLIDFLKNRYQTLAALKEHFETNAASWEDLLLETKLPARTNDGEELSEAFETKSAWTGEVAEQYFSLTDGIFREAHPNHLNLGVRFVSQQTPRKAIEAAGRYVDVMTINFYDMAKIGDLDIAETVMAMDPQYLRTDNYLQQHYEAGGRPILVTEWGFRAADAGLPNSYPPIYPILDTQTDRADAYEEKFQAMLDRPWFVGQHWFLYADQPPEGRFDGEDNNFGIVNEEDDPYTELTERWIAMYKEIYVSLP